MTDVEILSKTTGIPAYRLSQRGGEYITKEAVLDAMQAAREDERKRFRPALSGEVTEMQIKHHLDTINNCSKVFFEITKCARLHAAKEIALKKYKELEFFKAYVKTSSLLKPQEPESNNNLNK